MNKEKKKEHAPLKREFSAGGVVYRHKKTKKPKTKKTVWLVGKHSGYHKWVLPKGLIESGEEPQVAAVREVGEETGVQARIVDEEPVWVAEYWYVAKPRQKTDAAVKPQRRVGQYQEDPAFQSESAGVVRVHKQVRFYLMEWVSGDPQDHDWEMEEARWCDFDEALELLAFEDERRSLRAAQASLLKAS